MRQGIQTVGMALLLTAAACGVERAPVLDFDAGPPPDTATAARSPDVETRRDVPPESAVTADASGADGGGDGAVDGGEAPTGPTVVGAWRNPAVLPCVDAHVFTPEGAYTISASSGERVVGTYVYRPADGGTRGTLSVRFDSDNGMPDCTGARRDETGLSHTAWVEFDPTGAQMTLYGQPSGGDVRFRLVRE